MCYVFALDHVHYARWLSIYLRELVELKNLPSVYEEFCRGGFVVKQNKTKHKRTFSSIAFDHAHEQCNAIIKGDGGAISLTTSPDSLRRWMVAGPEITRLLHSFEKQLYPDILPQHLQHHEATPAFKKVFKEHVEKLLTAFKNEGNPFQDDSNVLFAIDSTVVADESSIKAVHDAFKIGEEQYKDFVERRLKERTTPVTAPIPHNKQVVLDLRKKDRKMVQIS